MGAGVPRGLQIRLMVTNTSQGEFDSHPFPLSKTEGYDVIRSLLFFCAVFKNIQYCKVSGFYERSNKIQPDIRLLFSETLTNLTLSTQYINYINPYIDFINIYLKL